MISILDSLVIITSEIGLAWTRIAITFLLNYPAGTREITRVLWTSTESYPEDPGRNRPITNFNIGLSLHYDAAL